MSATFLPESSASTPHTPLESPAAGANRRRHKRLDYRTAVVAIVGAPGGFRCLRCQTDDVSFEGARLVCFEPLPAQAVLYLRILMPGLSERFVEAEIVNERVHSELRFGVGLECRYTYGVRFKRLVADAAMLDRLRIAAAARPPTDAAAQA